MTRWQHSSLFAAMFVATAALTVILPAVDAAAAKAPSQKPRLPLTFETKGAFADWALAAFAAEAKLKERQPRRLVLHHYADLSSNLQLTINRAVYFGVARPDSASRFGTQDRLSRSAAAMGIVRLLQINTHGVSPYWFASRAGWFVGLSSGSYLRQTDMGVFARNIRRSLTKHASGQAVAPFVLPQVPASGELALAAAPSHAAIAANQSLRPVTIVSPPQGKTGAPVFLQEVVVDPSNPDILVTGHVTMTDGKPAMPEVWLQVDDLGLQSQDPAKWQYAVPVQSNGRFAEVVHLPFAADNYEVQVAPPLTTAQTSLTYTFAVKQESSSAAFTMTYRGQDTDQQLGSLASVWANSTDPNIVALATAITKNATTPLAKAQAVYNWEAQNIDYNGPLLANNGYGWSTTEETLATKKGICVDYANVADAFMRALGIPTQMVVGYAEDANSGAADNGNTGHAWNRSWINSKWIYWDPTWSRAYLTSAANQEPQPGDLYIYQPQWFNPSSQLLDSTHTMSGILDQ